MPDASDKQTSCEFDFSALALPVPLEFADSDSLQDVPLDVLDDDPGALPSDTMASEYSSVDSRACVA